MKMKTVISYPVVYFELYKLLKDTLGFDGSADPILFDADRVRPCLYAMQQCGILKWKGKNLAVRKTVPREFRRAMKVHFNQK